MAPAIREAFAVAASPSGAGAGRYPKDAQLGTPSSTGTLPPDLAALARPGTLMGVDPIALINAAERPLIFAATASILGGAEAALWHSPRRRTFPLR